MKLTLPQKLKTKNLKKVKKYAVLFLGLVVLSALLFTIKSWFVVAVVNRRPITRFSLLQKLEEQSGAQVLDNLVQQNLILQEARKQKIEVTQNDLDEEVKKLEASLDKEGFKMDAFLQYQGLTRKGLEEQIKIQLVIKKILGKDIAVSAQEVQDYFNKNKDSFPKGSKLSEVEDQIKEKVSQTKMGEKVAPWLEELRENARILYFKNY